MAQIAIPKSSLEPRPPMPTGLHEVMFNGFKPKLSKPQVGKEQTVNMNPELKIINSPHVDKEGKPLNGAKVFTSLNLAFGPGVLDFVHCFGQEMTENGDNVEIPGMFDGDTSSPDPTKWGAYHGPLLGEVGKIEMAEVSVDPKFNKNAKPGDTRSELKRYYCRVPGCTVNHLESMIRS